ncbi:MAG: type II toxin-antitoxin system PemK/MazF family toxin [Chloroflexi bacterium]|nr:type II toxin-antitoxin system PemK/MazF family toxin [Chloroflexota bacterium]
MTKRGEIYLVNWTPGRGSEQTGIRPALVLQNDRGNQFSPTTIVAAVTTRQGRIYPFHVPISSEESGLPRDSIVLCEQLSTVDQSRLTQRIGWLNAEKMSEVDAVLHRSLGLAH